MYMLYCQRNIPSLVGIGGATKQSKRQSALSVLHLKTRKCTEIDVLISKNILLAELSNKSRSVLINRLPPAGVRAVSPRTATGTRNFLLKPVGGLRWLAADD